MPKLYFVTGVKVPVKNNNSWSYKSGIACLGGYLPLNKHDLKKYVRRYEKSWIIA